MGTPSSVSRIGLPGTTSDRRESLRACLSVPVMIAVCGRFQAARLRNLSENGAMIECAAPLHCGDHVVIQGEALRADGVVNWESDTLAGIAFETPLDDRSVARQILSSSIHAHRIQARA